MFKYFLIYFLFLLHFIRINVVIIDFQKTTDDCHNISKIYIVNETYKSRYILIYNKYYILY